MVKQGGEAGRWMHSKVGWRLKLMLGNNLHLALSPSSRPRAASRKQGKEAGPVTFSPTLVSGKLNSIC